MMVEVFATHLSQCNLIRRRRGSSYGGESTKDMPLSTGPVLCMNRSSEVCDLNADISDGPLLAGTTSSARDHKAGIEAGRAEILTARPSTTAMWCHAELVVPAKKEPSSAAR